MTHDTWRDRFRPVITKIIRDAGPDASELEIRRVLRATGIPKEFRGYWPYHVWCDEIRRQLAARRGLRLVALRGEPVEPDARQGSLL